VVDLVAAGAGERQAHGAGCPRCAARAPAPCRVGVDVASIAEVRAALDRFGDRYTRRVFTRHELATSGAGRGRAGSLAARFAAKEATMKVLAPSGPPPSWREIEVCRAASGVCGLALRGGAAALARRRELGPMSVSLTHEAGLAVAIVVAAPNVAPCTHYLHDGHGPHYAHDLHDHGHGTGHDHEEPKDRRDDEMTTTHATTATRAAVRAVLFAHARLEADVDALTDDDDLFDAGMTSHATVTVMLELEEAFGVEFPDSMLEKRTFASVGALSGAVDQLLAGEGS
jgi:phosphopantetheine--protein transferase-like protein